MKKLLFVLFCGLFGIGVAVASEPDYVVVNDQVYAVESLRISPIFGFTGKTDEGRVRFKVSEVKSYRKNGEVYCKMPVVENGHNTGREAFMELITTRGGLAVYRQTNYLDSWTRADQLHVFKGTDYTLTVDQANRENLLRFFSFAI